MYEMLILIRLQLLELCDFWELILIIQNLNEPVEYWQCINQQGYCSL
jgi:hypothetical protein